ncbi:MAG: hypothetical protein WAJ85_10140 [Candidatus Baltobacteraceae bacterium]
MGVVELQNQESPLGFVLGTVGGYLAGNAGRKRQKAQDEQSAREADLRGKAYATEIAKNQLDISGAQADRAAQDTVATLAQQVRMGQGPFGKMPSIQDQQKDPQALSRWLASNSALLSLYPGGKDYAQALSSDAWNSAREYQDVTAGNTNTARGKLYGSQADLDKARVGYVQAQTYAEKHRLSDALAEIRAKGGEQQANTQIQQAGALARAQLSQNGALARLKLGDQDKEYIVALTQRFALTKQNAAEAFQAAIEQYKEANANWRSQNTLDAKNGSDTGAGPNPAQSPVSINLNLGGLLGGGAGFGSAAQGYGYGGPPPAGTGSGVTGGNAGGSANLGGGAPASEVQDATTKVAAARKNGIDLGKVKSALVQQYPDLTPSQVQQILTQGGYRLTTQQAQPSRSPGQLVVIPNGPGGKPVVVPTSSARANAGPSQGSIPTGAATPGEQYQRQQSQQQGMVKLAVPLAVMAVKARVPDATILGEMAKRGLTPQSAVLALMQAKQQANTQAAPQAKVPGGVPTPGEQYQRAQGGSNAPGPF